MFSTDAYLDELEKVALSRRRAQQLFAKAKDPDTRRKLRAIVQRKAFGKEWGADGRIASEMFRTRDPDVRGQADELRRTLGRRTSLDADDDLGERVRDRARSVRVQQDFDLSGREPTGVGLVDKTRLGRLAPALQRSSDMMFSENTTGGKRAKARWIRAGVRPADIVKKAEMEKEALTPAMAARLMGSQNRFVRGAGQMMGQALGSPLIPGMGSAAQTAIMSGGMSAGAPLGYAAGYGAAQAAQRIAPQAMSRLPQQLQGFVSPQYLGNIASNFA